MQNHKTSCSETKKAHRIPDTSVICDGAHVGLTTPMSSASKHHRATLGTGVCGITDKTPDALGSAMQCKYEGLDCLKRMVVLLVLPGVVWLR